MSRNRSDAASAIQRAADRSYAGPERRSAVRFKLGQLKCNLGRVLDLSSGGVRLLCRRKLRGRHELTLFDRDGGVRVEAEVRWSRRLGLWKHEIGLQFFNVSSDIAVQLTTLFSKHRIKDLRRALTRPTPAPAVPNAEKPLSGVGVSMGLGSAWPRGSLCAGVTDTAPSWRGVGRSMRPSTRRQSACPTPTPNSQTASGREIIRRGHQLQRFAILASDSPAVEPGEGQMENVGYK